jgi:hypothetical protein
MNCHRATAATEKERQKEKETEGSQRRFFSLSPFSVAAVALWHK